MSVDKVTFQDCPHKDWPFSRQMVWSMGYNDALAKCADARRGELTFAAFRLANVSRCLKWHPAGIESWSPSDWLTAVTGELGELASLLKMRNRERDGLPGNKFSPSDKQVADELADVLTYLDLLAAALGVDLGSAAVEKFNEVSARVGFPDRIELAPPSATAPLRLMSQCARHQGLPITITAMARAAVFYCPHCEQENTPSGGRSIFDLERGEGPDA